MARAVDSKLKTLKSDVVCAKMCLKDAEKALKQHQAEAKKAAKVKIKKPVAKKAAKKTTGRKTKIVRTAKSRAK